MKNFRKFLLILLTLSPSCLASCGDFGYSYQTNAKDYSTNGYIGSKGSSYWLISSLGNGIFYEVLTFLPNGGGNYWQLDYDKQGTSRTFTYSITDTDDVLISGCRYSGGRFEILRTGSKGFTPSIINDSFVKGNYFN